MNSICHFYSSNFKIIQCNPVHCSTSIDPWVPHFAAGHPSKVSAMRSKCQLPTTVTPSEINTGRSTVTRHPYLRVNHQLLVSYCKHGVGCSGFCLQTDHLLRIIKRHLLLGDYCLEWTYSKLFMATMDYTGQFQQEEPTQRLFQGLHDGNYLNLVSCSAVSTLFGRCLLRTYPYHRAQTEASEHRQTSSRLVDPQIATDLFSACHLLSSSCGG